MVYCIRRKASVSAYAKANATATHPDSHLVSHSHTHTDAMSIQGTTPFPPHGRQSMVAYVGRPVEGQAAGRKQSVSERVGLHDSYHGCMSLGEYGPFLVNASGEEARQ